MHKNVKAFYLIFVALSLVIGLLISPAVQAAADKEPIEFDPSQHDSVHAMLSGLSDEQVRQLLLAELKKEAEAQTESVNLEPEVKGPGAPLSRLLRTLNRGHTESDNRMEEIWAGVPTFLPDLYKVFVSL